MPGLKYTKVAAVKKIGAQERLARLYYFMV